MLRAMAKKENMHNGDLCINMNNHQNAIFHQLDNSFLALRLNNFDKHTHTCFNASIIFFADWMNSSIRSNKDKAQYFLARMVSSA
jgi:hypothetical protein